MSHQTRFSPRLMSNGYYSNAESDAYSEGEGDSDKLHRAFTYVNHFPHPPKRQKRRPKTRASTSFRSNSPGNSVNVTRQTIQTVTHTNDSTIKSTTHLLADEGASSSTKKAINSSLYGLDNDEDERTFHTHIRAAGDNQNTRRLTRLSYQANQFENRTEHHPETSQISSLDLNYSSGDDENYVADDTQNVPPVTNFSKRSLFRKLLSSIANFFYIFVFLGKKPIQFLYQVTTSLLVINTYILRSRMIQFRWRNFLSEILISLVKLGTVFFVIAILAYFEYKWPFDNSFKSEKKVEFSPKEPNNYLYLNHLVNNIDDSHQVFKLQVEDKLKQFEDLINKLTTNLSDYEKKFEDNLKLQDQKKLEDEKLSLSLETEISSKSQYLDKLKKQVSLIEANVATAVSESIKQISEIQASKIELENKISQLEKRQKFNLQIYENQIKNLIEEGFKEKFSSLIQNRDHLEDKSVLFDENNLEALLLKIQKEIVVKVKKEVNRKTERTNNWLLPSFLAPTVTESQVKGWIREALLKYSADRIGLADYALESSGGSIVSTRCSRDYSLNVGVVKVLGFSFSYSVNTPRTIIQPGVMPGECWAFEGFDGYVVIQLSLPIYISSITLEHIPKSLSITNISSAPKDFSIFGLNSANEIEGTLLGNFRYEQDHDPLQNFPITTPESESRSFSHLEIRISSNWGHPNFTCVYRLRVHGTPLNN